MKRAIHIGDVKYFYHHTLVVAIGGGVGAIGIIGVIGTIGVC